MTRQTISAVVLTMNVAPFVERCLKSITWVDEIVVIDGFSTDGTIDICKRYTDKIIQNKWDGRRFSTERNLGTRHAKYDWVLQIDPDECSTPGFQHEVLEMLSDKNNQYVAYDYPKKNYFLGHFMQYGGWYHHTRHFFKRGAATYEGIIHEQLVVNGPVGQLRSPIEHYPFVSLSQFIERHNRYSEMEARQILEREGVLNDRRVRYEMTIRPLKRFYKFYIRKKGYKDGIYGFIFSVLFAWVHFINWAKYWELMRSELHLSQKNQK